MVLSIEPNPTNLINLRRHLSLNNATNVYVAAVALSQQAGVAGFSFSNNTAQGHIAEGERFLVSALTLDSLLESFPFRANAFIKIDIEGGELLMLRGAAKFLTERNCTILISFHSSFLRDECLSLLESYGYTPVWCSNFESIYKMGSTADALFIRSLGST